MGFGNQRDRRKHCGLVNIERRRLRVAAPSEREVAPEGSRGGRHRRRPPYGDSERRFMDRTSDDEVRHDEASISQCS